MFETHGLAKAIEGRGTLTLTEEEASLDLSRRVDLADLCTVVGSRAMAVVEALAAVPDGPGDADVVKAITSYSTVARNAIGVEARLRSGAPKATPLSGDALDIALRKSRRLTLVLLTVTRKVSEIAMAASVVDHDGSITPVITYAATAFANCIRNLESHGKLLGQEGHTEEHVLSAGAQQVFDEVTE